MKQEKLFEALCGIGDDLLLMAQDKRYINHWRRWGRTAACLALVLCLTVFALPYFPMGCGAAKEAPAESSAIPAETPAETPAEAPAERPAEESAEEESGVKEEAKEDQMPEEVVTVWFADVAYEIQQTVEKPADLGELLGHVQASDGRDLAGCKVYASETPERIYVETETGEYLCGIQVQYQSEMPMDRTVEPLDRIVYNHTYFYRNRWYEPTETCGYPVVGAVTESSNPALIGGEICEPYSVVQYTAHAVDGLAVPPELFVQTPDGYALFQTQNEKTVARFSFAEVEEAIRTEDHSFLLEHFIRSFERRPDHVPEYSNSSELSAEELEDLFIASWSFNTGVTVETNWIEGIGVAFVAPEDVQWRLDRFLDAYAYDFENSERYDRSKDAVLFVISEIDAGVVDSPQIALLSAEVVGECTVALTVRSSVDRRYVIRFDADSWRYLSITTLP